MEVAESPPETPLGTAARVAHVVPEYLPRSATFIHTLLSNQTRFRPVVLARVTSNLDEFPVEIAVELGDESRRGRRRRDEAFARRVADEARRHDAQLLHAHFGWSGRDAVAARRSLRVPLVTTFYGRDLSEPERARFGNPYRRLFAEGDAFVVEGPYMARRLASVGAPADRIRVVPIGIDLTRFGYAEPVARETFVVVQAARFVEKKGVDLTLRAFAAARDALGPSELRLVGDGPLRPELEELARKLGIEGSVRFLGLVAHDEHQAAAADASAAIQPSRTASDGDEEGGAPTVILEFQAMGIPVVATSHADIPFVVPRPHELVAEEDVDGLAAALVRLAHEGEPERRARAREASEFVRLRHDARRTAAQVEDVYEEVLG